MVWCGRRDLNPHGLPHRILNVNGTFFIKEYLSTNIAYIRVGWEHEIKLAGRIILFIQFGSSI
jgi:hypothetical protein